MRKEGECCPAHLAMRGRMFYNKQDMGSETGGRRDADLADSVMRCLFVQVGRQSLLRKSGRTSRCSRIGFLSGGGLFPPNRRGGPENPFQN